MSARRMPVVVPVLLVLALLWVLLVLVAVQPDPSVPNSLPHPDIDGMMAGSDGLARLADIGWPAFSLQAATLILVLLMIALGVSRRYRTLPFWLGLAATAILFLLVWARIFLGYQHFLSTEEVDYLLGFPAPTAWVAYGIWASGLALLAFYVVGFRRFIYTHEDEAEFDRLVEDLKGEGRPALPDGE
ncbi:MAG: DUF4175 domain-containing protein [Gammaproteobacteria bacterium]|nr:DUF4175 domain-containing protein [Gammaproteobacteria bacterium]